MVIAYVDESGDDGRRGSRSYALGCTMVWSREWASAFDDLIDFRRYLRDNFGIPVRAEVKANYLLQNGGPFRANPLSEGARHRVYRGFMRLQAKIGLHTFAVVIDKQQAAARQGRRPASDIAWEYLLQRLERSFRQTEVLLVHDEGDQDSVRKRARKSRRAGSAGSAFGTGQLKAPFRNLLDDPVPRNSIQSYFLQMADMSAYAAFRKVYPPPLRTTQIVPTTMWDALGSARFTRVRYLRPGPPAIVTWP